MAETPVHTYRKNGQLVECPIGKDFYAYAEEWREAMQKVNSLTAALVGDDNFPGFMPQLVEVMREMKGDMKAFHRLVLIILASSCALLLLKDTMKTFNVGGSNGVTIEQESRR